MFDSVSIVLVGKYTSLQDSYMSVVKALEHASMRCDRKLILHVGDIPRSRYLTLTPNSGLIRPTSSPPRRSAILSGTTMPGERCVQPSGLISLLKLRADQGSGGSSCLVALVREVPRA